MLFRSRWRAARGHGARAAGAQEGGEAQGAGQEAGNQEGHRQEAGGAAEEGSGRVSRRPSEPRPKPTKDEILEYLRSSEAPLGKRELMRAFQLQAGDRVWLKQVLGELKDEGLLEGQRGRRVAAPERLPEVTVLEIAGYDEDGGLIARPPGSNREDPACPTVYMAPDKRGHRPAVGERVLARLRHVEGNRYEGQSIRYLGAPAKRVVGVYRRSPRGGGVVEPTNRQVKERFAVRGDDAAGAQDGELVLLEPKPSHQRDRGGPEGRVIERLGSAANPRALSLIAIAEHGIPDIFPAEAVREAEEAKGTTLGDRLDLRALPLVTIDGDDARDFDDAVFAEPDPDAGNPGGFRLVVAIADVAHYVTPGSALDREARKRGNSTYFPDRVVPMLPEALSNGWCSLKPDEDRGCLAVELWIDRQGRLLRHRFHRALMRSAARLTYERVQTAIDGATDELTAPLLAPVIRPLYAAFATLEIGRKARGTLDLDLPERRVHLNADGTVRAILPRPRLDSHRLIEAFMITANVAAAEALEARRQPCMYRVHEPPDPAKVEALREVLQGLDLAFPKGAPLRPRLFSEVLEKVAGTEAAPMVSELVLRCQSQARYAPENLGHFGLALQRYAHFTSPIRRYSDLLVHRALIHGWHLGAGGLAKGEAERFEEWGQQISMTERRSATAERDAVDRFTALFLAGEVGTLKPGRVASVTRFGLFVRLLESGADGLVPISTLPEDYYVHDEKRHALVGRRWGREYHLGESCLVRIREADALTGSLTLEMVEGEDKPGPSPLAGPRPRPATSRSERPHKSRGKSAAQKRRRR